MSREKCISGGGEARKTRGAGFVSPQTSPTRLENEAFGERRGAALIKRRDLWRVTAAMALAGCARKKRLPAPPASRLGYSEVGVASWYGHPYHGRRAASGEIYDMEKLTAAHRLLPFGAVVRVENLENGRRVEVRINDRGPFVAGRIIDLSRAAARQIRMLGPGTARVRLVVVKLPPESAQEAFFAVQTGAFRERANAERQRRALQARYGQARLVRRDGDALWRVLVGRETSLEAAAALAEKVRGEVGEAFVVRVDRAWADNL